MNIIQFLLHTFGENKQKEIFRCMDKATIICYDGENCLVADDIYIYYYVHSKSNSKKAYEFYYSFEKYMIDKLFYANNLKAYKKRCKKIEGELYQWLG